MVLPMPDSKGHFGPFGGRYVAETLMPALLELEKAYYRYKQDKELFTGASIIISKNLWDGKLPSTMPNV